MSAVSTSGIKYVLDPLPPSRLLIQTAVYAGTVRPELRLGNYGTGMRNGIDSGNSCLCRGNHNVMLSINHYFLSRMYKLGREESLKAFILIIAMRLPSTGSLDALFRYVSTFGTDL
jgi:hypothetical protein